jgi:ATP-dependent RNA helicase UAP56/SUB2
MDDKNQDEDVLDYEEIEIEEPVEKKAGSGAGGDNKLTYSSIHSTSFKDHMLKNELLRALQDCGFENPSEGKS